MMKRDLAVGPHKWSGRAWLGPGLAVFAGRAGHQDWHHHQAHQIAIGLDAPVTVAYPQGLHTDVAMFIPAGILHRLSGGLIVSIYLDVLADEARGLSPGGILTPVAITAAEAQRIADSLSESAEDVREAVRKALQVVDAPPASDPRLALVGTAIKAGRVQRNELAALVYLSPTRFSHWFVEQTGLPLRSYAKWLRLSQAVQLLASGLSLTDAAHASGFSDSAHFSRTFRALLGIAPSSALAEVCLGVQSQRVMVHP